MQNNQIKMKLQEEILMLKKQKNAVRKMNCILVIIIEFAEKGNN